jgi:hypothetical protein
MDCPKCGTALPANVRFCFKCGTAVASQPRAGWQVGLPWGLGGLVLGALVAVLLLGKRASPAPVAADAAAAPFAGAAMGGGPAPDISQMSPEQRASRLYAKIMSLHGAGSADSAQFFLPMALQAYAMLPTRNADAHFHIGVLDLTGGDVAAALAQADTIRRMAPTSLLGDMLRARTYGFKGDSLAMKTAFRDFLTHEAKERARKLPEYDEHAASLDQFHDEAVRVTGGAAKTAAR